MPTAHTRWNDASLDGLVCSIRRDGFRRTGVGAFQWLAVYQIQPRSLLTSALTPSVRSDHLSTRLGLGKGRSVLGCRSSRSGSSPRCFSSAPQRGSGPSTEMSSLGAENLKTLLNGTVVELETTESAGQVTRVHVASSDGHRFAVTAKLFILAAGGYRERATATALEPGTEGRSGKPE